MGHEERIFRGAKVAAVILAAVLGVCVAGAQEAAEPGAMLEQARTLIADGKAAEAKAALEKIVRDFVKKPEAAEAAKLIDRIKSIEVLVDLTHDATERPEVLPDLLLKDGYGVSRSHTYLGVLRGRLAEYELVVCWQETTPVKYDDLEYAVLYEYVEGGGHLVLISNAGRWLKENAGRSVSAYPVRRLAKRFGLKLKGELTELSVGAGKVYHYPNSTLLTWERLTSSRAEVRREAVHLFEKLLPYPQLDRSARNDRRDAEIVFREGHVTFRYPQTLNKEGLWARKALPRMLKFYSELFKAELPNDLEIHGIAATYPHFVPANTFNLSLVASQEGLLYQLGVQLYQAWMQPTGAHVGYPLWMERPWAEMTTTDLLTKLGVGRRYQAFERHHAEEFRRADPKRNRIDITISPGPADWSFWGKCEYIFRDLSNRHGRSLPRKFREIVLLYHEAGQLPGRLDTAQTIRLLSLAVGRDLFGYFRSLGTHVEPVAIDFAEPARLRQQIAGKKAAEEAAKKEQKKEEKEGNRTP